MNPVKSKSFNKNCQYHSHKQSHAQINHIESLVWVQSSTRDGLPNLWNEFLWLAAATRLESAEAFSNSHYSSRVAGLPPGSLSSNLIPITINLHTTQRHVKDLLDVEPQYTFFFLPMNSIYFNLKGFQKYF